jgi:hypothetical protein
MNSPSSEPDESLFRKLYGIVFITVFLALVGGISCAWVARSELATADTEARELAEGRLPYHRKDEGRIKIFAWLGIRDWRIHFALGAGVGLVAAVAWNWELARAQWAESKRKLKDGG